jgi:hypothetical protein
MSKQELTRIAEEYLTTLVHEDIQSMLNLVGTDGIVEDPRFPGNVGEAQISEFVTNFQDWISDMSPSPEHLRTTATEHRVMSEDILHIRFTGEVWEIPVATIVCKDANTGATRVHVYYTNWPFNKKHSVRKNLFSAPLPDQAEFEGAVLNYVQSLLTGDLGKIGQSFESDIYFREASGPPYVHWGRNAVVNYFKGLFANGAPMLRDDTVTDDGRTVFMEFSVVGWNGESRPEDRWEAGLAVYERSRDGLMAAIRIYDDVEFTF